MVDFVESFMNPQLLVMLLAAAAAFATVLTITMPLLSRDRMAYRMKSMATERDKMRTARMAQFNRDNQGSGRLRQTPKGFMQEIVNRLNSEINSIVKDKDFASVLEADGSIALGGPPSDLAALVRSDIERWRKLVRDRNIKVE